MKYNDHNLNKVISKDEIKQFYNNKIDIIDSAKIVSESIFSELGNRNLLNSSFNIQGEPIVCSPSDALRTFGATGLDILAIGDFILEK